MHAPAPHPRAGFVLKSVCTILRSALVLHVAGFAFTHPAGRDVSDLDSVAPANSPPSEISAATIRCAIQLYELQLWCAAGRWGAGQQA